MSDYDNDFEDDQTPQRESSSKMPGSASQKVKTPINTAMGAPNRQKATKQDSMQDQAEETKNANKNNSQEIDIQEKQPIATWQSIMAKNDTNRKIIMKFMKKGFTSLSAEDLACTMTSPDFTIDFSKNTKEDWMVRYQFKVVERLQKCNFNFKWKTRASSVTTQGMGDLGAFFELCKNGDCGRVLQFLKQWRGHEDQVLSEVDAQNKSGLHYAVEECHPQLVEYLINKGAKVDARDKMLKTPLHIACLKGYSIIVRLLIQNKADPYERDFQGRHSLHFACCSGSENSSMEILAILSGDSTDLVHMSDHAGRTPLHYAVFNQGPGQIRMIQNLLMYGANINCIDENRRTPLHFAAMEGISNIIPLLVQNGAAAGLKDYQHQTPMDLAATDNIRQQIIVYSPYNKFKPSPEDMKALEVDGVPKPVKKVSNIPPSYYEPYEHAQPDKKKKKNFVQINQKAVSDAQPAVDQTGKPTFTCSCQCQPAQVVPPEELCMNCRPLGPSNDWLIQKKTALPYNIRNYQAKLVENLKRVQEFGVESFQHVKKPYLFTGSWMEYVRNLDDLMLQINGVRPNEAVMKVFNILFPYEKPLPRGQGDELGLAGFYSDKKPDLDPDADLKDCHPDKLRGNIMQDRDEATGEAIRKNGVEDINDLLHIQQQMCQLQTANEMALVTIEEKDLRIQKLLQENEKLEASQKIKGTAEVTIIALEERIYALDGANKQLQEEKDNLMSKIRSLVHELEQANYSKVSAEADAALQEEMLQLKRKIEEMDEKLVAERQRNLQLRLKSGQAFMAALNDPNYQPSGGKKVEEVYDPDDDFALMRLLQKVEEKGEASLEQKLERYGDLNKYINQTQFNGLLKVHDTAATDYIRMNRIAGFAHMQGDVKKKKITEVMFRINDRAAMKERIEEQTLTHIAVYLDKQGYDLNALFRRFNTDQDEFLSDTELFEMLDIIHVNVNQQLRRIILAMFDTNKDNRISKQEFTSKLAPYTKKAPITEEQIESKIITQKDKKELVEMFNEENRQKMVFEDFKFDASDKDELARREAETIDLINNKKLPDQKINGEIVVHLLNFENLQKVEGKNLCMYRLKRSFFTEAPDAKVDHRKDIVGFMQKNFSWEEQRMNCKIPITDLLNNNLHMQGDTLLLQLFMIDQPRPKTELKAYATFVGELRIRYKHCLDEESKNNWCHLQLAVTDEDNKIQKKSNDILSSQINLEVRYLECGQKNSSFQADGTLKPQKPKYGALQKVEEKHDLTKQNVGVSGTLHCNPMFANFAPESAMIFDPEPTKYGVKFSFENDAARSETSAEGDKENEKRYFWMDTRQMSVDNPNADKLLNVTLVKLTAKGMDDVFVSKGQVPAEKLATIYQQVNVKQKSFTMEMNTADGAAAGNIKLKVMFTTELLKKEEKKQDELVPAGDLAAAARAPSEKMSAEDQATADLVNAKWKIYDTDNNGTLDKAEFRNLMKGLLKEQGIEDRFTEELFDQVFTRFDGNNSGTIDKAEATNFYKDMNYD